MSVRKEYEMLFQLQGSLASSFPQSFKQAGSVTKDLQNKMVALRADVGDVKKYSTLSGALKENKTRMSDLMQEQSRLTKEISASAKPTDKQIKALEKVETQIEKTKNAMQLQESKLISSGQELRRAGIDTDNLTSSNEKLTQSYNELKQKQEEYARVEQAYSQNRATASQTKGELLRTLGGAAAIGTAVYMGPGKAAMNFESTFAGVRKTVNATEEELAVLRQGILEMSAEMPQSAVEIAAVAEAAGQLGIENDKILEFTRNMVMMGDATNLSSNDSATSFARFANIVDMSQNDFGRLGSSVVALGNNLATTESEIVDLGMNIASAGKQVNLSESQIMGYAGALSSVGIEAASGGTSFSKMMVMLQLATETGSAGFSDLSELADENGLSFKTVEAAVRSGGKELKNVAGILGMSGAELKKMHKDAASSAGSLENLSKVAGMTSEEFTKAFKEDAAGAITAFLGGLNDTEQNGMSAIAVLEALEIKETRLRDTLLRAAGANDIFNDSLALSEAAWGENAALVNEANQRYETTESKVEIAKNSINNSMIEMGEVLLPIISEIAGKVSETAGAFGEWAKENPETLKTILKLAAGFVGLRAGGLAVKTGFLEVQGAGLLVKKVLMGTGEAIGGTVGSTGLLSGAMSLLTNPVGQVALGVGALTLGFFAVKRAMEKSREATLNFADGLSTAAENFGAINAKADETQGLITEYRNLEIQVKNLGDGTDEAAAAQERLHEIEQKLIDLNPEILSAHDAENGKLSEKLGLVDKLNERERASAKRDLNKTFEDSRQALPSAVEESNKLIGELGALNSDLAKYDRIRGELYDITTEYEAATEKLGEGEWMSREEIQGFSDRAAKAIGNDDLSFVDNPSNMFFEVENYNKLADKTFENIKTKDEELATVKGNLDSYYDAGIALIELDLGGTIQEQAETLAAFYAQREKLEQEGIATDSQDAEFVRLNEEIAKLEPKLITAGEKLVELNAEIEDAPEFEILGIEEAMVQVQGLIDKLDYIPSSKTVEINTNMNIAQKALGAMKNQVAARLLGGDIPAYAKGGIVTKPTLATFAEQGPEAAIPLDGSARAKSLWITAGQMLGMSETVSAPLPTLSDAAIQSIGGGFAYNDYSVIHVDGGRPGDFEEKLAAHRQDIIAEVKTTLRNEKEDKGRRTYGN